MTTKVTNDSYISRLSRVSCLHPLINDTSFSVYFTGQRPRREITQTDTVPHRSAYSPSLVFIVIWRPAQQTKTNDWHSGCEITSRGGSRQEVDAAVAPILEVCKVLFWEGLCTLFPSWRAFWYSCRCIFWGKVPIQMVWSLQSNPDCAPAVCPFVIFIHS